MEFGCGIVYGIYMELDGAWTSRIVIGGFEWIFIEVSFSSIKGEGIWFKYFEGIVLIGLSYCWIMW